MNSVDMSSGRLSLKWEGPKVKMGGTAWLRVQRVNVAVAQQQPLSYYTRINSKQMTDRQSTRTVKVLKFIDNVLVFQYLLSHIPTMARSRTQHPRSLNVTSSVFGLSAQPAAHLVHFHQQISFTCTYVGGETRWSLVCKWGWSESG